MNNTNNEPGINTAQNAYLDSLKQEFDSCDDKLRQEVSPFMELPTFSGGVEAMAQFIAAGYLVDQGVDVSDLLVQDELREAFDQETIMRFLADRRIEQQELLARAYASGSADSSDIDKYYFTAAWIDDSDLEQIPFLNEDNSRVLAAFLNRHANTNGLPFGSLYEEISIFNDRSAFPGPSTITVSAEFTEREVALFIFNRVNEVFGIGVDEETEEG